MLCEDKFQRIMDKFVIVKKFRVNFPFSKLRRVICDFNKLRDPFVTFRVNL